MQAVVNRDPAEVQRALDGRGILTGVVFEQQACPFHFAHRGGTRRAQGFQALQFLGRENRRRQFGLSGHAPQNIARRPQSVNVLMKRCSSLRPSIVAMPTKVAWLPCVVYLNDLSVTERKQAETSAVAFSKLGRELFSATTLEAAAHIITKVADELFGWDAFSLYLYAPE